jgi:hypothetical protein
MITRAKLRIFVPDRINVDYVIYRWGVLVSNYPWTFIIACLVVSGTCSIGMLSFTTENRPTKLWIPQDSGFVEHTEWLQDNFPNDIRFHSYVLLDDNVLKKENLMQVFVILLSFVAVTRMQ